jgi:hypothetical protein
LENRRIFLELFKDIKGVAGTSLRPAYTSNLTYRHTFIRTKLIDRIIEDLNTYEVLSDIKLKQTIINQKNYDNKQYRNRAMGILFPYYTDLTEHSKYGSIYSNTSSSRDAAVSRWKQLVAASKSSSGT